MNFLKSIAPHVHWGLRLSLAATFIVHGLGKFPPDGFSQAMGMPLVIGWLVALGEVGAGAALIGGAILSKDILTRVGGLLVIVIMIGAIFLVHLEKGFNVMNGGYEFQLLMLVTGLFFLAKGNDV
ncbi:MAG: DoxX family protein [Woeseiaceae bacterium]|nr:DoxX family protein [Woeseiaceae bacterium]